MIVRRTERTRNLGGGCSKGCLMVLSLQASEYGGPDLKDSTDTAIL